MLMAEQLDEKLANLLAYSHPLAIIAYCFSQYRYRRVGAVQNKGLRLSAYSSSVHTNPLRIVYATAVGGGGGGVQ